MGLERMASVAQNVRTNYETDLFMPIIEKLKSSGKKYLEIPEQDVAFKVIADHIRTIAFAISDGACRQMKDVAMFYVVCYVELYVLAKH